MTDAQTRLFSPCHVAGMDLASRLVMAPMTRNHSPGGIPTAENAAYYRRRAEAGIGLIISEGTWVNHPAAGDRPDVPRFHGEAELAGWKRIVDAVHEADGKFFPQLWHLGMVRNIPDPVPSIGPSGLAFQEADNSWRATTAPMTEADIEAAIDAYAQGAADAQRIGCDGIELHGAHGYLIDQFFWDRTNRRGDAYNGSIAQRTRFGAEVVRACKRATQGQGQGQGPGPARVCLRFSQWKSADYEARLFNHPDELEAFLKPLIDAGVDLFHCSTRRYWQPAFPEQHGERTLAGWTKLLSGKPTIAVGSVGLDRAHETWRLEKHQGYASKPASLDRLYELFDAGEFDLIAVGRALLADPHWPAKIKSGAWDQLVPYATSIRNNYY